LFDPYDVLFQYAVYLKNVNNVSNLTIKHRVVTVKNFFEYSDVDISPRKFKLKVKLPKVVKKSKEALTKEDIVDILNACADIRVKTYVMLLAGTGMRAVEALSVRVKDIDLQSNPSRLFVRGKFTKTRSDRTIFLTSELGNQLSSWLDYKYRTRRICHSDNSDDKTITEYRTPKKNGTDLIFAVHQLIPNPNYLYMNLCGLFANTIGSNG
jgi:integrase